MELFHVLNRGVDKRDIVMDDSDRARFVHDLFEFNDAKPAGSTYYSFNKLKEDENKSGTSDSATLRTKIPFHERQRIVDIHGWCLMHNHYHLLLSSRIENGLTLFIRKLNIGYAKYFNKRHHRDGALFQGRTKKIHIENNPHFLHILNYIHLNPLDYIPNAKKWRGRDIKNITEALNQLHQYRWSSYLDYCGDKNFPSVLNPELFREVFDDYKNEARNYLAQIEAEKIRPLTLE